MGLSIISTKSGTGSSEAAEFKHKAKELKRLASEICEDIERMSEEFGGGGVNERSSGYREGYRDGLEDAQMRRRNS